MDFWDWINKKDDGKRLWFAKRWIVGFSVFLFVPVLIYLVVKWDPSIGIDEDGKPVGVGLFFIIGLYWCGAYFAYKRYEARKRLNELLDRLLDEEEVKNILETARNRREFLRQEGREFAVGYEKGEKRVRWFNIE